MSSGKGEVIPLLTLWAWIYASARAIASAVTPKRSGATPSQVSAQLRSEKSCAETVADADQSIRSGEVASELRPLIGIRPDGGIRVELKTDGWCRSLRRLRESVAEKQRATTVAGESALVRRRGDALEVHLPGRARLLVQDREASLTAEARAMDLGGAGQWGERWIGWATRALADVDLGGLTKARAFGWRLVELPLCADFGFVLEMVDGVRGRWVGVTRKTKFVAHPGDGDELATLYIGGKKAGMYARIYLKSRQLANGYAEDSTLHQRLREGGWDGGPFVRIEAVFRDLALRPRGEQGGDDLGFDDPALLADPEAQARLWAYAFGHPGDPDATGRYRLLAPDSGDLDPRWRVVQAAAVEAPVEGLAQVRPRRDAELHERRRSAHDRWVKSVGEVARLDGYTPRSRPSEVLEHMADRTRSLDRQETAGAILRADALHGDLLEESIGGEG